MFQLLSLTRAPSPLFTCRAKYATVLNRLKFHVLYPTLELPRLLSLTNPNTARWSGAFDIRAGAGAAPCAVLTSEVCDEGFRESAAIGASSATAAKTAKTTSAVVSRFMNLCNEPRDTLTNKSPNPTLQFNGRLC